MQNSTILFTATIAEKIKRYIVQAPEIALKARAGQFVILRLEEEGERIPLTIVDADPENGTITLVVQEVGKTTNHLAEMNTGDCIRDLVGPLGNASKIVKNCRVVVIGGGVGTAVSYPVVKALKASDDFVTTIIGARNKDLVILKDEMSALSDACFVATDDGSCGQQGFVTDILKTLLESGEKYDHAYAMGPLPMMRAVTEVTRRFDIPTMVSLNPIMVDGTGMCGGCRVRVGGENKFACVDGPEFDGHLVDFTSLINRNRAHKHEEQCALEENIARLQALSPKERMAISRHEMPERPVEKRIHCFEEVNLGFSEAYAIQEANRCLQCRHPACVEGCPVGVRIPDFLHLIEQQEYIKAAKIIHEDNVLSRVCARVCPQSDQCEGSCILTKRGEAVAIGALARFVTDYAAEHETVEELPAIEKLGYSVAVVGSGPAGLSCAGDLIRQGYDVTVFEAFHDFGGVLIYGIPEFRLPKEIVQNDIAALQALGVKFQANTLIGVTYTVDELLTQEGFDAVFIGVGAGLPYFMEIPGENLIGVFSANEFLTRVNLMKAWQFPRVDTPVFNVQGKHVAVIGGGNTALDSARVALRLGASQVDMIYRRSEAEMPGRIEEIKHAKSEGVRFQFLCNPVAFYGDEDDWLTRIRLIRMELGEPDTSGRRRPEPVEGSEFEMPVDMVVIAIGNGANPIIQKTTNDLEFNKRGNIIVDSESMYTGKEGVFAGGDIVTGGATVILAMSAGRKAAASIDRYLSMKSDVRFTEEPSLLAAPGD
ncbi:MAG: NADPH-dependent glutamate synthase [Anaerolineales bacterium]|nr:NADPH-dependent glutamate synthase [Anaerolineales bacterium]